MIMIGGSNSYDTSSNGASIAKGKADVTRKQDRGLKSMLNCGCDKQVEPPEALLRFIPNPSPHDTHPTMTDRPKRNAVANREATDKLLDNRKRRSSAQVQQEKETAAITAAAAEIDKTNLEAQRKRRIAAFEDQLRREDQQRAKSMARPDQQVLSHRAVTA